MELKRRVCFAKILRHEAGLLGLVIFLILAVSTPAASNNGGSGLRLEAKEVDGPRKRIAITVGDPSGSAPRIVVNAYFIGRAPNDGPRFIYADSEVSFDLHGLSSAQAEINVAELRHDRIKRRPPKGLVYTGIGEAEGWIVTGASDAKLLQMRASSPALLALAKTGSSDSLAAMIADYRKRQQGSTSR